MLPARPIFTSAGVASRGSAAAAMIMPGVQIPHCVPPSETNARCKRMAPFETLDRDHLAPAHLSERDQARVDRLAVQQDGARAALALAAAFLGARQAAVLAQDVEQALHRMRADVDRLAVHCESHDAISTSLSGVIGRLRTS